ncbi:MAG: LysM peptidoglycan-binding domain-containing protein, partial [Planctomycetaceae bacterium]|nr:LysM peptidoglycan-binding domain-containing protein [Planctomycetaceae bacterium]
HQVSGKFRQEFAESGSINQERSGREHNDREHDENGISSLLKSDLGTPVKTNTLPQTIIHADTPPGAQVEKLPQFQSGSGVAPLPPSIGETYVLATSAMGPVVPQSFSQEPQFQERQLSPPATAPNPVESSPIDYKASVQPSYTFAVASDTLSPPSSPPSASLPAAIPSFAAPPSVSAAANPNESIPLPQFSKMQAGNTASTKTPVVIPHIFANNQESDQPSVTTATPVQETSAQVTRLPGIENELTINASTNPGADSNVTTQTAAIFLPAPQTFVPQMLAPPSVQPPMQFPQSPVDPAEILDDSDAGFASTNNVAATNNVRTNPQLFQNQVVPQNGGGITQPVVAPANAPANATPQPAPTVVMPAPAAASFPTQDGNGSQVSPGIMSQVSEIGNQLAQGDVAGGYARLNDLYFSDKISPEDKRFVTKYLDQVAVSVVFSKRYNVLEPLYIVQNGDTMESIANQYQITPELLRKINQIPDKAQVTAGAQLKVIRGPLDVLVYPNEHELVILSKDRYACRFPICTGFSYAGQRGQFAVQEKVLHPEYNLMDRAETIPAGSPENPLGSRWIRFSMQNGNLGLHGTNHPECVGTAEKTGGVFGMREKDIIEVFDMVVVGSKVTIIR